MVNAKISTKTSPRTTDTIHHVQLSFWHVSGNKKKLVKIAGTSSDEWSLGIIYSEQKLFSWRVSNFIAMIKIVLLNKQGYKAFVINLGYDYSQEINYLHANAHTYQFFILIIRSFSYGLLICILYLGNKQTKKRNRLQKMLQGILCT